MRLASVALLAIAIVSLTSVLTAANTVPVSHAAKITTSIGPNDLKPSACASLTLTNLVTGSGVINGTGSSDLILGSSGIDSILAGNGNDCMFAGGGSDVLNGGSGTDVCDGGPGLDVFDPSCKTQTQ